MKRGYWEDIAPNYDDEIFDVYKNDKKNIVKHAILKYKGKSETVIDLGCAAGKWIPLLAENFQSVTGVDISQKNIDQASINCKENENVKFLRADITKKTDAIPQCDFAICINAILSDNISNSMLFFKSLSKVLHKEGMLVLVVPSLESAMLSDFMLRQWNLLDDILPKKPNAKGAAEKLFHLKQGNIALDNVPTKHYLEEELSFLLKRESFQIAEITKIEYNWKTEFESPPPWMEAPYPWDWMVVAKFVQ